jgi:hypothetical protein
VIAASFNGIIEVDLDVFTAEVTALNVVTETLAKSPIQI